MILRDHRLIYLHLQKTGGNSISRLLLPFSDDRMATRKHQDGVDRFGISGEYTRRKHAKLADYELTLGATFEEYDVAISVRDPLQRAVSMYFSPHRWFVREGCRWHAETPRWCPIGFAELVARMPSATDFLATGDGLRSPDAVIRFDSFDSDLRSLIERYRIPARAHELSHVNRSAGSREQVERALADPEAGRIVRRRFEADYELMGELQRRTASTVSGRRHGAVDRRRVRSTPR